MSEWFQGMAISRLVFVGVVAKWALRSDRLEVVRLKCYDVLWKWWFHVSPNQRPINLNLSSEGLARGSCRLPRRRRKQSRRLPRRRLPRRRPRPRYEDLKKSYERRKKKLRRLKRMFQTGVQNICKNKRTIKKLRRAANKLRRVFVTFFLKSWACRGSLRHFFIVFVTCSTLFVTFSQALRYFFRALRNFLQEANLYITRSS